MTKREYAEAIAELVNGEVNEVEKANGVVMTAILPKGEMKMKPNMYIDTLYNDETPIEEAAETVKQAFEANSDQDFDPSEITDFTKARKYLRVRLYNKKTSAEVFISAARYGFDDLIIIPYLEFTMNGSMAAVKVTEQLLNAWDKTKEQVMRIARRNSLMLSGYEVKTMVEVMREIMGDMPPFMEQETPPMYVVTNANKSFGAYGVIALNITLKNMFPEGYAVLPSSIHEVIVIPKNTEKYDELKSMINEVNDTVVEDVDVLGYKPYFFG